MKHCFLFIQQLSFNTDLYYFFRVQSCQKMNNEVFTFVFTICRHQQFCSCGIKKRNQYIKSISPVKIHSGTHFSVNNQFPEEILSRKIILLWLPWTSGLWMASSFRTPRLHNGCAEDLHLQR